MGIKDRIEQEKAKTKKNSTKEVTSTNELPKNNSTDNSSEVQNNISELHNPRIKEIDEERASIMIYCRKDIKKNLQFEAIKQESSVSTIVNELLYEYLKNLGYYS